MKKNLSYLTFLVFVAVLLLAGEGYAKARPPQMIKVDLQRSVGSPWMKNSTTHSNDFCFHPKYSRPKKPTIFKTPMPTNCTEARVARISEECVFKNLAYSVKMYYGPNENGTSSIKQKDKSDSYLRLAIDLSSPWSWIKSPVCQTCDRTGKNCGSDKCSYSISKNSYDRTFPCEGCEVIQKCGEIDSYAEGMTVVGQFISASDMRFKGQSSPIGSLKLLWAHALSGQSFLQADGVLGLGIEENTNSKALQSFNGNLKPQKKEDEFRQDDTSNDDLDDEESEEESQEEETPRSSTTQISDKSLSKYDSFEPEMNLISHVMNSNKGIKSKIFSLYIADDDSLNYQMIIGEPQEEFIYKPRENKILYISSMVSTDMQDTYGLWVVNLKTIRIARLSLAERKRLNEGQKSAQSQAQERNQTDYLEPLSALLLDNHKSILSLSTTALVLPGKELKVILEVLKNEYGFECAISKDYLYFVICDNIKSPKDDLADMTMILEIGYHSSVYLQVNPADLILNCKKATQSKDSLYRCQMNLQQSYDDKIILGEAVLRNQYLVFNQQHNMMGFAPAKNTFNHASFVKKIGHLFVKIEEVIEADIAYIVTFLLVMILSALSFLYFRHGPTILALLQGKKVLVLDDKNERIALSTSAHESMDESVINELQQMQQQMEDPSLNITIDDGNDEKQKNKPQSINLVDL